MKWKTSRIIYTAVDFTFLLRNNGIPRLHVIWQVCHCCQFLKAWQNWQRTCLAFAARNRCNVMHETPRKCKLSAGSHVSRDVTLWVLCISSDIPEEYMAVSCRGWIRLQSTARLCVIVNRPIPWRNLILFAIHAKNVFVRDLSRQAKSICYSSWKRLESMQQQIFERSVSRQILHLLHWNVRWWQSKRLIDVVRRAHACVKTDDKITQLQLFRVETKLCARVAPTMSGISRHLVEFTVQLFHDKYSNYFVRHVVAVITVECITSCRHYKIN